MVLPKYIHEDVIALSVCDPIKIPEPCKPPGMSECLTHIHPVMDSLLLTIMSQGEVDQLMSDFGDNLIIVYVAQVYYKDIGDN